MLGYPPNPKGREAWFKKIETSLSPARASAGFENANVTRGYRYAVEKPTLGG